MFNPPVPLVEGTRRCSRRALLRRASQAGITAAVGLALLGNPQDALADTCSARVYPRDLGGGSVTNRNYVIEVPLKRLPSRYSIYYKGKQMNLAFHGIFNGRLRWGVSTKWAYVTWGWTNGSNWQFYYECSRTGYA